MRSLCLILRLIIGYEKVWQPCGPLARPTWRQSRAHNLTGLLSSSGNGQEIARLFVRAKESSGLITPDPA